LVVSFVIGLLKRKSPYSTTNIKVTVKVLLKKI